MCSTCGAGWQPVHPNLDPSAPRPLDPSAPRPLDPAASRPALMARLLELEQQVAALRDQLRRHSRTIPEQQAFISHQWARLVAIRSQTADALALPGADA